MVTNFFFFFLLFLILAGRRGSTRVRMSFRINRWKAGKFRPYLGGYIDCLRLLRVSVVWIVEVHAWGFSSKLLSILQ